MSVIKDRQKMVLSAFAEKAPSYGLSKKMVRGSFPIPLPIGIAYLHVGFIVFKDKSDNYFEFVANVAIRHERLETLVGELSGNPANSSSMAANLGYLESGTYKTWGIADEDDIPIRVNDALNLFEKYGKRFIDENSNEKSILEVLSTFNSRSFYLKPFNHERGNRALALAYLMEMKSDIPALYQRYVQFMEKNNDSGLDFFKKFAQKFSERYHIGL